VLINDAANKQSNLSPAFLEDLNTLVAIVTVQYNILKDCSKMNAISTILRCLAFSASICFMNNVCRLSTCGKGESMRYHRVDAYNAEFALSFFLTAGVHIFFRSCVLKLSGTNTFASSLNETLIFSVV
jgi:hypothetical protein